MRAGISFRQVEAFHWIARSGSFSEAARLLNATQPAISNRIRELERLTGARLFERRGRAVRLTPAGRDLQAMAEQLVALGEAFAARAAPAGAIAGMMRIGAADTVALTWLPRLVARMSARYPRLAVELSVDLSTNLRARLADGDLDIAFLVGTAPGPEFSEIPFGGIRNAWMAARALGLGGRRVTPRELAAHPVLTHSRGSHLHRVVMKWFANAGIRDIRIHGCNSLATMIEMTIAGLGVSVLSPDLVRQRHGPVLDAIDTGTPLAPTRFTCVHAGTVPEPVLETVLRIARREMAREPCFRARR
jgi:DNA-binding transcriptional LysR family regulator